MTINIALAGNPNSGKTTLFNELTGSNQFVGNWPGVTVEKKVGNLKKHKNINIIDLPGVYSLSPYTLEEVVSRDYLINEKPDVILNIIDGTNLERNLYLTTQLIEIGIPIVIAINMMDLVEKNGDIINIAKLSEQLGCKIIKISALKGTGVMEAAETAIGMAKSSKVEPNHRFNTTVEQAITNLENEFLIEFPKDHKRWYAIKLFERDEKIIEKLNINSESISRIESEIQKCEFELDDDSESIITTERYSYIDTVIKNSYKKKNNSSFSNSDKIDAIVTNRFLALPIFAFVMFVVYFVSVTTIGTMATDFANDGVFGEGFELFGVFIPGIPVLLNNFLESIKVAEWLHSLLVDGIVAGVGAVLGFVPQMLILFFFLAFLEACGYMARVAFIMDRIFRKFGLSGKSFIPMLIGTGCGVPGIMATRTIENERDRRMTVITTTFIPCGAKLPIIALISGSLFNGAWWVAPSAYFVGIMAIVISGIILKKTKLFSGDPAPFVMELPAYHFPTAKNVLRSMWERGYSFIQKAGTVILLSTIVIWFGSNFGFLDGKFGMVDMTNSLLAKIGQSIAFIFSPLGWGNWKSTVATITGLIAKENVVGTFGVLYGFSEVTEDGQEIWSTLTNNFTAVSAYSFLVFNLLCAPCFAAIGAIKREMNNINWLLIAIFYQTIFAYVVALCIYQYGTLFTTGIFTIGTFSAIVLTIGVLYLLFRKQKNRG